ncbi:energy transducer TonB [Sinimarinibacterium flocculans]|uniref:energy transducer TonB n=1 Tax=Sinimarinibacterium flocculans TaxID=985250 RepID=UPI0024923208|nr:energy transducer TonB [Sinimarinibacterium flocculans]
MQDSRLTQIFRHALTDAPDRCPPWAEFRHESCGDSGKPSVHPSATVLMHAAGAVHEPAAHDPVVRKRPGERGLALSLSVALHVVVFLALLLAWPDEPVPAAVPPAAIVATLVSRPSSAAAEQAAPQAQPMAKPVEPVTPPEPQQKLNPKPRPLAEPRPASTPPPSPEASTTDAPTASSTTTTTMEATTPAAGAVDAVSAAPAGPVMVQFPYAYLARISRTITWRLNYPAYSRQFGEEGRAIVRITLQRDGTILDAVVVRPTGYYYLDAEARNVILRIARFPPVPEHIQPMQSQFIIDQPITFRRG